MPEAAGNSGQNENHDSLSNSSLTTTTTIATSAPKFSSSFVTQEHLPTQPLPQFNSADLMQFAKISGFIPISLSIPSKIELKNDLFAHYCLDKRTRLDESPSKLKSKLTSSSDDRMPALISQFRQSLAQDFASNMESLCGIEFLAKSVESKERLLQALLQPLRNELAALKAAVSDLSLAQVQSSVAFAAEIHSNLLPAIQKLLLPLLEAKAPVNEPQKQPDLPEESKHLSELAILLTKNKDLSRELSALKTAMDATKVTHETDLQTLKDVQLHHQAFMNRLATLFERETQGEEGLLIEAISELKSDRADLNDRLFTAKTSLQESLEFISQLKQQVMQLQGDEDYTHIWLPVILEVVAVFEGKLDSLSHPSASFDALEERMNDLVAQQDRLTHCALNNHLMWQSKYSALTATLAQLKSHLQTLTTEQVSLRIQLQTSQKTASQLSVDLENSLQKTRTLEALLSAKKEEFKTKDIEILQLRAEREDAELQHRHDRAAFERKIAALEMRLEEESRLREATEDRLSGIQKHEKRVNSGSVKMSTFVEKQSIQEQITKQQRLNEKTMFAEQRVFIEKPLLPLPANVSINEIPATIQPERKKSKPCLDSLTHSLSFLVFAFTGIRSDSSKFQQIISNLGGSVCGGINFSEDLTHVLAPPGYVSIRVLGGALSGKWIVPPAWLDACAIQGRWLPELDHGGFLHNGPKPFRFKTLWMSAAFAAQHARHQTFQTESLRALLTKLGKARFTERAEEAEILLVTEEEVLQFEGRNQKEVFTLTNLISKIPISK